MKMPKLEVKPPRGTTIHVRGKSLGICLHQGDMEGTVKLKIKQSIATLQAQSIPIAKIIITGKTLKRLQEMMVFAHQQFKGEMGKGESILYRKEQNKEENCYQLVYTYHIMSTPFNEVQVKEKIGHPSLTTRVAKLEEGELFTQGVTDYLSVKAANHENMITFLNNNYTDTRLEIDALRKLTTKLYRSIMGCLFLISGLALTIAIMQAGLTDPYVIGAGVAMLGMWIYIGTDSILLPWLRKRAFYKKYQKSGATVAEVTDALAACAQAGGQSIAFTTKAEEGLASMGASADQASKQINLLLEKFQQLEPEQKEKLKAMGNWDDNKKEEPSGVVIRKIQDICRKYKLHLGCVDVKFSHTQTITDTISKFSFAQISLGTGEITLEEFFIKVIPAFKEQGLIVDDVRTTSEGPAFQAHMEVRTND